MAIFTGLGKSRNGAQSCENVKKLHFISSIPPYKPTSMFPNTIVLKSTFVYLSKANHSKYPNLI